jgi:hypothetical protein
LGLIISPLHVSGRKYKIRSYIKRTFFGQLLGLGEWKGTSKTTIRRLVIGLALLIVSAAIAGYGGHLGAKT